jgi:ribulose-phosphate 3-epimerase
LARTIEIAPSILSADFVHLARDIEKVERAGADIIHLDIMDGHFVPNLTIGPPVVASIRKVTKLPLDVHLMIDNPERYIDDFRRAGADWISVHNKADVHLDRTLNYLKKKRFVRELRKSGNVHQPPGRGAPRLRLRAPDDGNPGFGGQKFNTVVWIKIRKLRKIIASNKYAARIE